MQKLCTDCLYIGLDAKQDICNIRRGIKWILVGLITIPFAYFIPYILIISWIIILGALNFISTCFSESNKCPKCKNKSMISINGKHAKKIIEENNLVVPTSDTKPKRYTLGTLGTILVFGGLGTLVTIIIFSLLIVLVVG